MVEQLAQKKSQQHCGRNDESDLRIARQCDRGIVFLWGIGKLCHARDSKPAASLEPRAAKKTGDTRFDRHARGLRSSLIAGPKEAPIERALKTENHTVHRDARRPLG